MPLLNADTLISNVKSFRTLWLMGRPGSFKTALAFRIAHELLASGFSRYLISNVRSPWRDDPAKVELREGKYADVVCVIDEGGLFLKTGHDAESLIAFTRKLNVVLLVPSYTPPTARLRQLYTQRMLGLGTIGIPVQTFAQVLHSGAINEQSRFFWRNPAEIYGLYDTDAMASDDAGVQEYVYQWTSQAKQTTKTLTKYKGGGRGGSAFTVSGRAEDDERASDDSGGPLPAELSAVEGFRGASDALTEAAEDLRNTLSVLGQPSGKRRR